MTNSTNTPADDPIGTPADAAPMQTPAIPLEPHAPVFDPAPAATPGFEPAPQMLPEPTPVPLPVAAPAPARATAGSRPVLIATTIAIIGVLLSAVAGGSAGLLAVQLNTPQGGTGLPSSVTATFTAAEEPIAAAAATALPSVVNIDVTGSTSTASGLPNGHPTVPSGGTGSGVAYKAAPDGGTYIITNNHVVADSATIVVTPASGERITATLVGTDPDTDIAVVKVDVKIPLITVGDSERLVVGQTVVAIGSPFGLQHSVSSGVVSALHRSITTALSSDTTVSSYPLVDVIQTDAAINPGNSGGALVDRLGRLLGIDSAIYTESGSSAGVGFAIPEKTAVRIADELIAGGSATHPFLGVEGRTVNSKEASAAGLAKPEGALIANIIPKTGAAKAGLKSGDIVTALNGVAVRTMDDLILAVRRSQVGDKVTLTVWRNHASISVIMTVGDKPASLN
jgi:S1-C subfamily serine protease